MWDSVTMSSSTPSVSNQTLQISVRHLSDRMYETVHFTDEYRQPSPSAHQGVLKARWQLFDMNLRAGAYALEVSNAGAIAFAGCCLKSGAIDNGDLAMAVSDDATLLQL